MVTKLLISATFQVCLSYRYFPHVDRRCCRKTGIKRTAGTDPRDMKGSRIKWQRQDATTEWDGIGGVMAWRLVQGMCYKIWVSCFASRPVREVPLYQISMVRKWWEKTRQPVLLISFISDLGGLKTVYFPCLCKPFVLVNQKCVLHILLPSDVPQ